ncbi:MAG: acetyl-CoA carboxylase biotin carboxylase subunit [Calditrichaeota bacterium]|nr:acetyl-CoA carboxylase biotin carboxylase subunit [Calditrichota bacterium]
MFKKILIANRGEIALRVIRACRELGVKTVAVYSQADADALHIRFADEAVCIGPAKSKDSYLFIPRIIGAAEITGADALHPGYGFLAENAQFAEMCIASDIAFIGPSPETIRRMGDKALARRTMAEAGVPILPGSKEVVKNEEDALQAAEQVGYPVILKASAGGGGKGMRIVRSPEELPRSLGMAKVEAETAFSDGSVYIERYLERPRHIEVQVMGYTDGKALTFGERDCSIQRRHQKLIEEAPSPVVKPELRQKLLAAAVKGAESVGYIGAGTIEFLLQDNEFYFMEMNTRIQVEHPVTEMIFRHDLVKEQIQAAAGKPHPQSIRQPEGHAIECRINAEDPNRGFTPSPGQVTSFHIPGGMGIRVDTHVYAGYVIPPHYDSLIAKLIAFGNDREEAVQRMLRALDEFIIEGIATTIPLHKRILQDNRFRSGEYSTAFMGQFLENAH